MTQLETAGALPATWLPFIDIDASEPLLASQASTCDASPSERTAEAEAADTVLYVSPPPMPWPRVFPGL
jgi:hypothetical protein